MSGLALLAVGDVVAGGALKLKATSYIRLAISCRQSTYGGSRAERSLFASRST